MTMHNGQEETMETRTKKTNRQYVSTGALNTAGQILSGVGSDLGSDWLNH
jgi:hypothetical protein